MKIILYTCITISLLAGCDPGNGLHEKNSALIEKYIGAVEAADTTIMSTLLAEDYLGMGPSYGDSIGKVQAIKNWHYNVKNLYEKIHYNRSRTIAVTVDSGPNQGEWVSNWAELEITYKNTGDKVIIWANSIYEIKEGQISRSFTFYNEADALNQLGYVFINPNDY